MSTTLFKWHGRAALLLSAIVFPTAFLHGGLTLNTEIRADRETTLMRMLIDEPGVRMEVAEAAILWKNGSEEIIVLPTGEPVAIVMGIPKAREAGPSAGPEQAIAWERTGKRERIGSYDCEQVLCRENGRISHELWVSDQAPDLAKVASSFAKVGGAAAGAGGGASMDWTAAMSHAGVPFQTFPIRTITYRANGQVESQFTVLSHETTPIAARQFEIPPGRERMAMPAMMGAGAPGGSRGAAPARRPADPPRGSPAAASPMERMMQLQEEIQRSGQPPTPAQMAELQELAEQMQRQQPRPRR